MSGASTATLGGAAEGAAGELVDGNIVEDDSSARSGCGISPRGGILGVSDMRFGVSPTRGGKPDAYVHVAVPRAPAHGLVTVPPDVVVEVVSPRPKDARRDRVEKTAEYAAFGVRHSWIVDAPVQTLEVPKPRGSKRS